MTDKRAVEQRLADIHGYKLVYYQDGSGYWCHHKVFTIPGKCIECGALVTSTTNKGDRS